MSEAPQFSPPPDEPEFTSSELDMIVSAVLRVGLILACTVMVAGVIVHFSQGPYRLPDVQKFHSEPNDLRSIDGIWHLALRGDGLGLMQLAVLILLATPIMRVIFAAYGFGRQRDVKFVVVCLIVLIALMFGLYFGKVSE